MSLNIHCPWQQKQCRQPREEFFADLVSPSEELPTCLDPIPLSLETQFPPALTMASNQPNGLV